MNKKISKKIPCPRNDRWGKYANEIDAMKSGDSILVETDNDRSTFLMACLRHGKTGVSRKEKGTEKYRCWVLK